MLRSLVTVNLREDAPLLGLVLEFILKKEIENGNEVLSPVTFYFLIDDSSLDFGLK